MFLVLLDSHGTFLIDLREQLLFLLWVRFPRRRALLWTQVSYAADVLPEMGCLMVSLERERESTRTAVRIAAVDKPDACRVVHRIV